MKLNARTLTAFLAASSIALAIPFAAQARPMWGGGSCDGQASSHGHRGGPGMEGMGPMGGGMHRMMRGLDLTDAQQDQVFKLMHDQSPKLREQMKTLQSARQELRKLEMSGQYDEAKVRELSERSAKAMAEMAQMRARTTSQVYQLLTPEQRKAWADKMEKMEQRMEERGGRMGPMGERGHGLDAPGMADRRS